MSSRQQARAAARQMKKEQLGQGARIPTMEVPVIGAKPKLHQFAQSVSEIELLGDLVLIREISQEKTEGGIVLPDGARQEGPRKGEVMAVGPGLLRENGEYMRMNCVVGDLVYLTLGRQAVGMNIGGEDYHMVPDSAVLMKVRKPAAKDASSLVTD